MEIEKEFFKKIITTEDVFRVLEEIKIAEKLNFQHPQILLSQKTKEKVSFLFQNFLEELEKEGKISKDLEKNAIFLANLKNYLLNLPQVKIELAFLPKKNFLEKLSLFFEKELKRKVILNVIFNPKIGGGVILEFGGKYLDLSLAKEIDKIFEKRK